MDNAFRNTAECIKKYLSSNGYSSFLPSGSTHNRYIRFCPDAMKQYIYPENDKRPVFALEVGLNREKINIRPTMWTQWKGNYYWERLHEILCELYPDTEIENAWINYEGGDDYALDLTESPKRICELIRTAFSEYQPRMAELIAHLDSHGDELRQLKRDAEAKDAEG